MKITKEFLVDWLREEVPDGAEMKIDVGLDGQLDLVALFGKDQYALIMGQLLHEDDEDEDETTNEHLH